MVIHGYTNYMGCSIGISHVGCLPSTNKKWEFQYPIIRYMGISING